MYSNKHESLSVPPNFRMGNSTATDFEVDPTQIETVDRSRARWTPTDVIAQNLRTCPPELEPLVLYTCGSLCPVHRQHIHIQELAKKCLESRFPVKIVAGLVASSHDNYVHSKYTYSFRLSSFIPWGERMNLIELAIKGILIHSVKHTDFRDHPWIRADHWDGNQETFSEYFDAQKSLKSFLNDWCAQQKLRRVTVLMW